LPPLASTLFVAIAKVGRARTLRLRLFGPIADDVARWSPSVPKLEPAAEFGPDAARSPAFATGPRPATVAPQAPPVSPGTSSCASMAAISSLAHIHTSVPVLCPEFPDAVRLHPALPASETEVPVFATAHSNPRTCCLAAIHFPFQIVIPSEARNLLLLVWVQVSNPDGSSEGSCFPTAAVSTISLPWQTTPRSPSQ